jgi:hypothetical protein
MPTLRETMLSDLRNCILGEPSAAFYNNDVLYSFIDEACKDFAIKALCCQSKETVQTTANVREIDISGKKVVKILAAMYGRDTGVLGKNLTKIYPKGAGKIEPSLTGTPLNYYEIEDRIGLDPIPDTTGKNIDIYAAVQAASDDSNIPAYLAFIPVLYAGALAKTMAGDLAQAQMLEIMYINSCNFHRIDLFEESRDSMDDSRKPLKR